MTVLEAKQRALTITDPELPDTQSVIEGTIVGVTWGSAGKPTITLESGSDTIKGGANGVAGASTYVMSAQGQTVLFMADVSELTWWALPFGGGGGGVTQQTLTDGANISWNVAAGSQAIVTLAGNRALDKPINYQVGQRLVLTIVQDGTGSRTLTWDDFFLFGGGTAPTLTTTPDKADMVCFNVVEFNAGANGIKAVHDKSETLNLTVPENLGPELINNGDFSSGTGWTLSNYTISGGELFTTSGSIPGTATHDTVSFDSAKTYRVTLTVNSVTGTMNLQFNGTTDQAITTSGAKSYDISPTSTGLFRVQTDAFSSCNIDDLSIKEIL